MRLYLTVICFLSVSFIYCQHTVIPSGTSLGLDELVYENGSVYMSGSAGYLARYDVQLQNVTSLNAPYPISGYFQNDLHVFNSNDLYVSCFRAQPNQGYIFASTDGGNNWEILADTTMNLFTGFVMFDTISGCILQSLYEGISTTDKGENWNYIFHGIGLATDTYRLNDSTAFVGATERVSITSNKGQTWGGLGYTTATVIDIHALSSDSIFTVASGSGYRFVYNLNASVGGGGWTNKWLSDIEPGVVFAKSNQEIFIAGQRLSNGRACIIKTTDLGNSWKLYDFGVSEKINDIIFTSDSTALVCGSNGFLAEWDSNSAMELLGINEFDFTSAFEVYPNPASTSIKIEGASLEAFNVKINNSLGQNIHFIENYTSKSEIDISSLPSGIYSISIENSPMIKRFVKQ